jgi:hypothetical protein
MGHKIVCLTCRKAFSNNLGCKHDFGKCQECGGRYVYSNHKFRPPKRTDLKAWKVVKYLIENGFNYQHVNDKYVKLRQYGYYTYAEYPNTMQQAKEFVVRFKAQAVNL